MPVGRLRQRIQNLQFITEIVARMLHPYTLHLWGKREAQSPLHLTQLNILKLAKLVC
jgi:hypothetical protein